jgi:hypothetical protein
MAPPSLLGGRRGRGIRHDDDGPRRFEESSPATPTKSRGINAVLGHWAVHHCDIAQEDWDQVWVLRNALFHGDLTEDADTRSKVANAILNLRLILGLALKHVLKLSDGDLPHLQRPAVVVTDMQITAPPFTPAPSSSPQTPQDEAPDLPNP